MALQLYHYWDSTCCLKVRMALEEKAVPYEKVFVDLLKFEQLDPDYLALNPGGVAPTLVHDGRPIIESTAINEYIEEVFPEPALMPAAPAERAAVRAWVRLEDGKLQTAIKAPSYNLMIKPTLGRLAPEEVERIAASHPEKSFGAYWKQIIESPVDQAAVEESKTALGGIVERLDRGLGDGRPWLAGAQFSLADCAFACMVDRVEHLGFGALFEARPTVAAWMGRLKARPPYGRAIPPDDARMHSPLKPAL